MYSSAMERKAGQSRGRSTLLSCGNEGKSADTCRVSRTLLVLGSADYEPKSEPHVDKLYRNERETCVDSARVVPTGVAIASPA